MSSSISSALQKLDGSLLALQSEVDCLRAGLEVDEEKVRQRLAEAREHATTVRDLIRAERGDAKWDDRQALNLLIHELDVAAHQQLNEQRRTRLLELAGEFEAGSIKHRFDSRVSALNALRSEAIDQLRADAALPEQEKILPGPDAGEWLHWACNLQEETDGSVFEGLRRDFPAVEHFTSEMEESYWVPGIRAAVTSTPTTTPQPAVKPAKEPEPAVAPVPAAKQAASAAAPAPAAKRPSPVETATPAAKETKPIEPVIRPDRKPAAEPTAPTRTKVAAATVAIPQQTPAPTMTAQVAPPVASAKAVERPAKESRPAAEPVRPSAPAKQWQAAATAPAKDPAEKKTVAATSVGTSAPVAAVRMKYCDKCGSTYPAQFNVCPIDTSPLRFTNEPATTARDGSAVVDGAAVATAVTAAHISSTSRTAEEPAEGARESSKVDFAELRATLRQHSEEEAHVAEEHRGPDWQALLRDKDWRALAANPVVLAAATLVLILLVGGILWRAHRSRVSNDSVRAMEKAPDQPTSNPQPALDTSAVAATPTTVNANAATPSQPKPAEQNAGKQPPNVQQPKPANDTQNSAKPAEVLSLPMPAPRDVAMAKKPEPPANDTIEPPSSIPGALPNTSPNNLGAIAKDVPVAVPTLTQQKLRVSSGVAQAQLTHNVNPQYPPEAFQSRVHGTVVLQAVIGKDGGVKNLKVVSGPPMLIKAATEAVKQWRYKPFTLNGEPVEADTQINVNFTLGNQ